MSLTISVFVDDLGAVAFGPFSLIISWECRCVGVISEADDLNISEASFIGDDVSPLPEGSGDDVGAFTQLISVVSGFTIEDVGSRASIEGVVAVSTGEGVISVVTKELIVV